MNQTSIKSRNFFQMCFNDDTYPYDMELFYNSIETSSKCTGYSQQIDKGNALYDYEFSSTVEL